MSIGSWTNFEDGFARDRAYVYHNGNRVAGAGPKTFVALHNSFGRDEQHVFYTHYKLQGADARRWRLVNYLYSQDDNRVFYQDRPVKSANPQPFRVLDADQPHFAYDGEHFFCNGRVSSASEYADDLDRQRRNFADDARMLRSGRWEKLHRAEMRPYSPEESA